MPLSLADVLSAQAGGGPVYEGGPDANVTLGGVLSALGAGGPSWLERAQKQTGADIAAYQRGGVPELMADTSGTQDLSGGFGGGAIAGPIKAYHGSPYDFAKFDISKIGTGEGAQAYGHGLYFAENPEVARSYKAAGQPSYLDADRIGMAQDILKQAGGDRATALNLAQERMKATTKYSEGKRWQDVINNFDDLVGRGPGKMYEVNINAEPGQFLQWDKPLSEQQHLISQLEPTTALPIDPKHLGRQFYDDWTSYANTMPNRTFEEAKALTSQRLQQAGIPGIRYLDQGSRSAGGQLAEIAQFQTGPHAGKWKVRSDTGEVAGPFDTREAAQARANQYPKSTSNYVVFNPEIVDILKKYGLAGLTMGGVLTAAGQEPAPSQ